MSRFIIRVELHNAEEGHYEVLHAAMNLEGFKRKIVGLNGVYHLPPAEYTIESSLSPDEIAKAVRSAANLTDKKFGVLITEAQTVHFFGLDKVDKDHESE